MTESERRFHQMELCGCLEIEGNIGAWRNVGILSVSNISFVDSKLSLQARKILAVDK